MNEFDRIKGRVFEVYNEGYSLINMPRESKMGHPIYEKGADAVEARINELLDEFRTQRGRVFVDVGEAQRPELLEYIDGKIATLDLLYKRAKESGQIRDGAGLKSPFAAAIALAEACWDEGQDDDPW